MSMMDLSFEGQPVRMQIDDHGDPWWVAKDVCACLGLAKYRDAISHLAADERCPVEVDTRVGKRTAVAVSEPGLYRLIFKSRKAVAEPFKRWVFHEVLPSIRRTGRYEMPGLDPAHLEMPPDAHLWLKWLDKVQAAGGRVALRRALENSPLPQIPPSPVAEHELASFVRASLDITGDGSDFVKSRELYEIAEQFYRSQGRAMPGKRSFANMLLAALTGADCIVPVGMVRHAKRSDTGYIGLRVKTCAGTGVPALSAD